jgi:hypothetical protein
MPNAPVIALTGKDTIAIDEIPFVNFGPGDVFTGEFPNNVSTVEIGKNGNIAAALNANGQTFEVVLRVLRGSPEDIYLTQREAEYLNDPPSFETYTGNFVKRIGDGSGAVQGDNYAAIFGLPKKLPMVKENTAGDITQAIAEHYITFGSAIRFIS